MPEVETMVDRLQKYIGLTIRSTSVSDVMDRYLPDDQQTAVMGQQIQGVFRRGKFIIFMLERGALVCHNAMSGYWDSTDEPWTFDYVEGAREPGENDIRARLFVSHPENDLLTVQCLRFHDARKFGQLRYLEPSELAAKIDGLGPEIVASKYVYQPTEVINEQGFIEMFRKVRKPIKVALMEQQRVVGLGNIYAAEACWVARIDPRRIAKTLNNEDLSRLYFSSQIVLQDALNRNLDYSALNVYRRKECPICETGIVVEDLKGRSTYLCPQCQR